MIRKRNRNKCLLIFDLGNFGATHRKCGKGDCCSWVDVWLRLSQIHFTLPCRWALDGSGRELGGSRVPFEGKSRAEVAQLQRIAAEVEMLACEEILPQPLRPQVPFPLPSLSSTEKEKHSRLHRTGTSCCACGRPPFAAASFSRRPSGRLAGRRSSGCGRRGRPPSRRWSVDQFMLGLEGVMPKGVAGEGGGE